MKWWLQCTYSFCEINKRGLKCAGDVTISKHITLYGPWSVLKYHNLTTNPIPQRGLLLDAIQGYSEQFCGCERSIEFSRRYDDDFTE